MNGHNQLSYTLDGHGLVIAARLSAQ